MTDLDLRVLAAVGGNGNAVLLTDDADHADTFITGCAALGWRGLVLIVDEGADDHTHRPHESVVQVRPDDLAALLAERYHSGMPIHAVLIDAPGLAQPLLDAGQRPWILRTADAISPAGYRLIETSGADRWLLADAHAHLAGGIAAAIGASAASSPDAQAPQPSRSLPAKAGRRAKHLAKRIVAVLPGPVRGEVVRRRHLTHVVANQEHLTDPAYLGRPPADVVDWITPEGLPPVPAGGVELTRLTDADRAAARAWLVAGPYDDDALLDRRTDNHGDELGRVKAALRLRLRLDATSALVPAVGPKVLIDARCLQTPTFGARGIGRFAKAALLAAREAAGDAHTVLLVDRALEVLPPELAGDCEQVTRIDPQDVSRYSVLVQPSPMTASAAPLVPLLHSTAHKIAIVFDFIPAHYPTIYLRHPAARAEYAAGIEALRCYDEFICISHLAERELREWLSVELDAGKVITTSVAWPDDVLPGASSSARNADGPIVVMTGDEPRKNTYGALAAIGTATAGGADPREVIVIGMAHSPVRVHHWAIAAALREGEAVTLGRVSDGEMHEVLAGASAVVVSSFDEGLSLPVIEALVAGTPVIASDIPAHRELIGEGSFLAPAGDIGAMATAIRRHRGRAATQAQQLRTLRAHQHDSLAETLTTTVRAHRSQAPELASARQTTSTDNPGRDRRDGRLSIGVATPWEPQRSGVADFSTATIRELAKLADVTVYTTSGARVEDAIAHASVDEILANGSRHDAFVTVVGNSHFHIPLIELMGSVDAVAIAHDTRMVEYYMAMRAKGGVQEVMLRGQAQRELTPSLDEQIDDMRLLQNAGFWEIAHQAKALVLHAPSAAGRIEAETGITPHLLPFANQRVPDTATLTEQMRAEARERLGLNPELIHVASFGFVDFRTKLTDVVVESAAWLTQWGHRIALHIAGAATEEQERALRRRAAQAGIAEFTITGFLDDAQFRDHLLAVDIGLQLRISPLLGVSGPLSDLAAFGTTSIASRGLAIDVDTPDFVDRLPDDVSSLIVAEALEHRIANPIPHAVREQQRVEYLERKSPARYAAQLLALLEEVADR